MHRETCFTTRQCHNNTCHTEYDGLIGRVTRLCLALRAAAFTALFSNSERRWCIRRIRTSDRSVRSRVLYPAELRMQNGGEAGFEPRMQLLTAYSLAGAPSASRPPHHTRLFRVLRRTCFCSSSLRWRTYYFLVLISQTLFRDLFRLHTSHAIRVQNGKRAIYQQEISPDAGITPNDQSGKGNEKRYGAGEKQKREKAAVSDAPHCTARRGNLSNWTAGIFQPEYAGRSLHGEQTLL